MQSTNFFSLIRGLNLKGKLNLKIEILPQDLVIALWLDTGECSDPIARSIPRLTINGTAASFDRDFFDTITNPIQETDRLICEVGTYQKELEKVRNEPAAGKVKQESQKKDAGKGDKKYQDALKKSEDLEKAGKYREAWAKLPDPLLHPGQASEIRARRDDLSARFSQPDLFASEAAPQPSAEPADAQDGEQADSWQ
ncbi:MAG: hypothetical protein P0Y53_01420 [Candidatus Pseudobacter hemicellulosilyticus]|uniref:ParB-related ThiF-related cassette protein E domain-containing protein n=1 Tax=Candidatus Pseudobacter hemicellulosilyticus TaxID=3121375 RepID=A0AAJ5WT15_9BACT|nr:MAG: hypothetical protein P0Y53_01420 [Pseudobacter sp.]